MRQGQGLDEGEVDFNGGDPQGYPASGDPRNGDFDDMNNSGGGAEGGWGAEEGYDGGYGGEGDGGYDEEEMRQEYV